jgi:hypothetical protein
MSDQIRERAHTNSSIAQRLSPVLGQSFMTKLVSFICLNLAKLYKIAWLES